MTKNTRRFTVEMEIACHDFIKRLAFEKKTTMARLIELALYDSATREMYQPNKGEKDSDYDELLQLYRVMKQRLMEFKTPYEKQWEKDEVHDQVAITMQSMLEYLYHHRRSIYTHLPIMMQEIETQAIEKRRIGGKDVYGERRQA